MMKRFIMNIDAEFALFTLSCYSRNHSGRLQIVYFSVKKDVCTTSGFFSSKVTSSFIELFVQGTEDTELTLTREGDYVGSTDDFAEVSTIELILPKYL